MLDRADLESITCLEDHDNSDSRFDATHVKDYTPYICICRRELGLISSQ